MKNQVEFQDMDISRAMEGCAHSRRQQDLLHEGLAARKRALRDTRIRGIHDLEALRRVQQLRTDEFSKIRKYAADHYLTFPVHWRHFLFVLIQETAEPF